MILDIQQQTPEWHQLRQKSIGASDAATIMGVSPWATEYELWLNKLGLSSQQTNSSMTRGNKLEDSVRKKMIEKTGYNYIPCVVRSNETPYIIASLDGYDKSSKKALEIKCPNKKDHAQAMAHIIPEKYVPQLQHQMYALEIDEIIYSSCSSRVSEYNDIMDDDIAFFNVYRDDKYIKELLEKEKRFFSYIEELVPPPLTDKDYVTRTDDEWNSLATGYAKANSLRKYYEQQEEILKRELHESAQGKNVKGCGVFMQKIVKKGTIDYRSIPEIKELDLESYRKPNTEYYRINVM